jgi:pimeloyl-ACP methyl ester carboxylesterase
MDLERPSIARRYDMRGFLVLFFALIAFVGGIVALLGRRISRREDIDWADAPKAGKILEIDGDPIHYIDEGAGPAVILVHGFGGHTYSFRYQIPALAGRHRVIAVDLLGFGYSGRNSLADLSNTAQARRVVALMDALGIAKASLVGHSMGGAVVMRIAAGWPERVEKLVLVASVPGDSFRRRLPIIPIKPLNQLGAAAIGWLTFRRSFYDVTKATDEIRQNYRAPFRIRGSYDSLMKVIQDTKYDRPVETDKITAPVLLVFARAERIVPGWMQRRLRERFPAAEVATIDRAGHLLLEEQPEDCTAVLRGFLPVGDSAVTAAATGPADIDSATVPS